MQGVALRAPSAAAAPSAAVRPPRSAPRAAATGQPSSTPRRGAASFLGALPARRERSLAARAGFSFELSVADGTLTWNTGGGRWNPGSGGSGGGGGGGGGSGGPPPPEGWPVSRGFAWAAALFFMAAKSLVCWCSVDPKAAATNIDLGFLLGMALLACASLTPSPLAALRPLLIQLTLGHITLEMAFYGVILNVIDPAANYKMSPEMWLHHIAVAVGGAHTVALMAQPAFSALSWVGTQLIVTEITTFLPVAFHQAIKNKRMTGYRSVALGVLFPSAFALRCVMSARVFTNYMAVVKALGGTAAVPYWWVSGGCSVTILGLNLFWTAKILYGGVRQVMKRRSRAAATLAQAPKGGKGGSKASPQRSSEVYGEGATVYSEASEAAVYSEMATQKKRQLKPDASRARTH